VRLKGVVCVLLVFMLLGCSTKVAIPDVIGADESTAKTILTDNGIVPIVEYDYNQNFAEGIVYKMQPQVNSKVEKNSKVTISVSKGKELIYSTDSVLSWYHVYGSESDYWEFENPYIGRGYLIVNLTPTINSKYPFEWEEYGYASINDTFSKSVPIRFKPISNYGDYTLEIPLDDLDIKKPTTLYIQLNALINNQQKEVNLELRISW